MNDLVLSVVVSAAVMASVLAVAVSVWLDFRRYGGRENTQLQKHSVVATGTMTLFFMLYYAVVRFRIGECPGLPRGVRLTMIFAGTALVVLGAAVNIWGRLALGRNWANHIKIYENHTLVIAGPFRYIRHPLYSSLFWMCYGGGILYANWLSVVLTSVIFVPMMQYRAKQEEKLLAQVFEEYPYYAKKAGRFLPKSLTGYKREETHHA